MSLPSDAQGEVRNGGVRHLLETPGTAVAASALPVPENNVSPFEFRSLSGRDACAAGASIQRRMEGLAEDGSKDGGVPADWQSEEGGGAAQLESIDAARQEGFREGEQEGRRAMRAEMDAEMRVQVARERERIVDAVRQFHGVQDRYFADVEQEVVKLALAIAARVLHREATLDPLLLTGAVRVALENMADRSGVVVRVSPPDVAAWERMFQATEPAARPSVLEGAALERGECLLETRVGTVDLGLRAQLEEIEKGFYDLLHHRPMA